MQRRYCMYEDENRINREIYKVARIEAKLAVTITKMETFDKLLVNETTEGMRVVSSEVHR
ncbi:hypothetical protein H5410_015771 [Solanum commersonii]|uniref:Uncharacterized protein n=1 Tax=Solanum commersonii TaxID=4109 RepID=A0A9J5ZV24_SOLCO|nr:hypothetical protein H5410_015771 [Solanum commersonii]